MIRIGESVNVLLVLAHPSSPGQRAIITTLVHCSLHPVELEPSFKYKVSQQRLCNFIHSNYYLFTTNCTGFNETYNVLSEICKFKHHQLESHQAATSCSRGSHSDTHAR